MSSTPINSTDTNPICSGGVPSFLNDSSINYPVCLIAGNGNITADFQSCCIYGHPPFVLDNCLQVCQVLPAGNLLNETEAHGYGSSLLDCLKNYDVSRNISQVTTVGCINPGGQALESSPSAGSALSTPSSGVWMSSAVLLLVAWKSFW